MNASASEKSRNFQVRSIALPARVQPGTSRRRAAISSSERRARRATNSGRTMAGKRLAPGSYPYLRSTCSMRPGRRDGLPHDHDRGLRDDVESPGDVEAHLEDVAVI